MMIYHQLAKNIRINSVLKRLVFEIDYGGPNMQKITMEFINDVTLFVIITHEYGCKSSVPPDCVPE